MTHYEIEFRPSGGSWFPIRTFVDKKHDPLLMRLHRTEAVPVTYYHLDRALQDLKLLVDSEKNGQAYRVIQVLTVRGQEMKP